MSYNINSKGYYGSFGGAYIPEMLLHNIEELKDKNREMHYQNGRKNGS